jgi:hypothetical protein
MDERLARSKSEEFTNTGAELLDNDLAKRTFLGA